MDDFTDDDLSDLPMTWFDPPMRTFLMIRHQDHTGTSGTGIVAEGVEFSDGTVVIRWCCPPAPSTCVYASTDELLSIHGHGGSTELYWFSDDRPSVITP